MAAKYDHLRAKAIELRTKHQMTLEDIVERLALPKTTVYYWIKDLPIPRTEKQNLHMDRLNGKGDSSGPSAITAKYAALREQAYQQGLIELPELLKDATFRDFVVMYMGEGTKRDRNTVALVNSDVQIVQLAHKWILKLTTNKNGMDYWIQYHADHDENELKAYWGEALGISPEVIKAILKTNSGQLSGRQFRSQYGLLTVRVGDTYLRARLQAWMDFIKSQW